MVWCRAGRPEDGRQITMPDNRRGLLTDLPFTTMPDPLRGLLADLPCSTMPDHRRGLLADLPRITMPDHLRGILACRGCRIMTFTLRTQPHLILNVTIFRYYCR